MSAAEPASFGRWSCTMCTLINSARTTACTACGTPRDWSTQHTTPVKAETAQMGGAAGPVPPMRSKFSATVKSARSAAPVVPEAGQGSPPASSSPTSSTRLSQKRSAAVVSRHEHRHYGGESCTNSNGTSADMIDTTNARTVTGKATDAGVGGGSGSHCSLAASRVKRKRVHTKHAFEVVDPREQLMIQRALANSRTETAPTHVLAASSGGSEGRLVDAAPTFYPSVAEFEDPLAYIDSIRALGEKYGICKIRPPAGWQPPFALDRKHSRTFVTKHQEIHRLQEGRAFAEGKRYTHAQYERMANKFHRDWFARHDVDPSDAEGISRAYWRIVETGTEPVEIDYANDLDTSVYGSGFPGFPPRVDGTGDDDGRDDGRDDGSGGGSGDGSGGDGGSGGGGGGGGTSRGDSGDSVVKSDPEQSANDRSCGSGLGAGEGMVKVEIKNEGETEGTGNIKDARQLPIHFDYATTGWNLNRISKAEGSAIRPLDAEINGVNVPWLYCGMLFSTFCWHTEDNHLPSINYMHLGAPKQWYGVPGKSAHKWEGALRSVVPERLREEPDLVYHLTTMISPSLLMRKRCPVYQVLQKPGEFVVTFCRAYHAGFSHGYNVGEAVNFATPHWLRFATQCNEQYRKFRRPSAFSHDRVMCTLLQDRRWQHNFGPHDFQVLRDELSRMYTEELALREEIQEEGITNSVRMPRNSPNIDEQALTYDDKRRCIVCQHACFLSAIVCRCNSKAVGCLRHRKEMCKCPASQKCWLFWKTADDLQNDLQKISGLHEQSLRCVSCAESSTDDVPS